MKQINPNPDLNKALMYQHVETPHEHWILGSSNFHQSSQDTGVWHTPVAVLDKKFTVEEAQEARRELGFFLNPHAAPMLGLKGRIAISFEDLDPKTGETLRDPRVLGVWDQEKERVVPVPERDLTAEFRVRLKELEAANPEIKFHLREEEPVGEGVKPTSLESKS